MPPTAGETTRSIRPRPASRSLRGQRPAKPLGAIGIHEDARLLQEDGAAQAGAQDEMTFEDRARGAEDVDDFRLGHGRVGPVSH